MTKLHYVGFNGYHQCPKYESGLPKVITQWMSISENGFINSCTHRFIVIDGGDVFKIYGVLNDMCRERLLQLAKPAKFDSFRSCDEFLVASEGTKIWKYNYKTSEWLKCELKFSTKENKSFWEEGGNRIEKYSFQENVNDLLMLLSNGSVWMLSEDKVELVFSYNLERAIDISSGLEHSLILTESGCVLTFGNGSRGQLGHGDLNPISRPVQVAALEGLKVTKIAAGGWHTCAITDSGDLYTWGWNNYGQLSAFEDDKEVGLTSLPIFVEVVEEADTKVIDVACGRRHTIALLENEDLYSTGWNTYSQLGIDSSSEKVPRFTKCQIKRGQNRKMICGPWYTILIERPKK